MLTPDNPYMRAFFTDREAIYDRPDDATDLVAKAVVWSENPEECERVGAAGYQRCVADGHSEVDRAGRSWRCGSGWRVGDDWARNADRAPAGPGPVFSPRQCIIWRRLVLS